MASKIKKTKLGTSFTNEDQRHAYEKLSQPWNMHWRKQYSNVTALVRPQKSDIILDVGCGTGKYEARYSHIVKHIVGAEIDKGVLAWAQRYARENGKKGNFSFVRIANERISRLFPKQKFSKIMLIDAVEHIPLAILDTYLQEFKHMLTADGRVYIYTPNEKYFWEQLRKDSGHISLYTLDSLTHALRRNGYKIIRAYHAQSHVPILNIIEKLSPFILLKRRLCVEARV